MYDIYMESAIGSFNVRYEVLDRLILKNYANSSATILNIFVDLNSILKPIFGNQNANYIGSTVEISASIINLCAHYREYFRRRGVDTRFFLIFGMNVPEENKLLCPGYHNSFENSYYNSPNRNIILNNLKYLDIICKLIPQIYYIDIIDKEFCWYVEYLLAKYQMNVKRTDMSGNQIVENMVITKDILPLQLVSSECSILIPKKNNGEDKSDMVSYNDIYYFWEYFMTKARPCNKFIKQPIDPGYFSNILAITRIPERNMAAMKSIDIAYDSIVKGIELGYLAARDYSQSTINKVLEILGINLNYATAEMRWKAINARFAAQFIIPNYSNLRDFIPVDINYPDELKQIVSTYYDKCPIDLDRL